MGKGDSYRPVDIEKYTRNWERIFGEQRAPAGEVQEVEIDPLEQVVEPPTNAGWVGKVRKRGQEAPWDDEACDRELDDNFCLDCMGHMCTCEEEDDDYR